MHDGGRLSAPFPYFGGKSHVAPIVWQAFGDPRHYIEPFCGSCAVLLARPNGGFFDPPYAHRTGRDRAIYAHEMADTREVERWCREHGKDERFRIIVAGLEGEYRLGGWRRLHVDKRVGMARTSEARKRQTVEMLWVSPHCEKVEVA